VADVGDLPLTSFAASVFTLSPSAEEIEMKAHPSPTFRILDEREGIYVPEPLPREWPLQNWFACMYDVPLEAFTDFDLARSVRQNIHIEAVMPYCLQSLMRNPLAGKLYDGELLSAIMRLPPDFWLLRLPERNAVLSIANVALSESDDQDLLAEIRTWVAALLAQQPER
jgi:hypothetical protein